MNEERCKKDRRKKNETSRHAGRDANNFTRHKMINLLRRDGMAGAKGREERW